LTALLPVLESESLVATASAWRRFFVAAFDAIRDHDPKLITEDLFSMEAYFRVMVAREDGVLPAWEGLRILRQKQEFLSGNDMNTTELESPRFLGVFKG
jgi:hypothetical protein